MHHHHGHNHEKNCEHGGSSESGSSHAGGVSDWRVQAAESRQWASVTDEERQKAFERGAQSYDDEIGTTLLAWIQLGKELYTIADYLHFPSNENINIFMIK